nr:unnamed protein product [Digitaria exilis]
MARRSRRSAVTQAGRWEKAWRLAKAEMETTRPRREAAAMRDVAAGNGGPRGGLLSRSHRTTTVGERAVHTPSRPRTISTSTDVDGFSGSAAAATEARRVRRER